jgi:aryl-alcohol dehydrogenase-like predicted oxidoreductase
VDEIAEQLGTPPSTVALAWLLRRDVPRIPIVGARNPDQLRESLGALAVEFTERQLATLHEASRPDLGFPHDFLRSDAVRHMVYGGMYDSIET